MGFFLCVSRGLCSGAFTIFTDAGHFVGKILPTVIAVLAFLFDDDLLVFTCSPHHVEHTFAFSKMLNNYKMHALIKQKTPTAPVARPERRGYCPGASLRRGARPGWWQTFP